MTAPPDPAAVAELQIARPKLVEAARAALRRIEVSEEIISRLQDVMDEEWRSVYAARARLKAILQRAGAVLPDDPEGYASAALRFVEETGHG